MCANILNEIVKKNNMPCREKRGRALMVQREENLSAA